MALMQNRSRSHAVASVFVRHLHHCYSNIYILISHGFLVAEFGIIIIVIFRGITRMVPRAVRGSVVGSSMDMWCPYGTGREFWDRVMQMLIDPDPPP